MWVGGLTIAQYPVFMKNLWIEPEKKNLFQAKNTLLNKHYSLLSSKRVLGVLLGLGFRRFFGQIAGFVGFSTKILSVQGGCSQGC